MYLVLLSRIHVETVCLRLIPRCIDACVRVCFFVFRATEPGHFKRLAIQRQLVTECLQHYNYMHPNDEYEPAPGEVTKYIRWHYGTRWTHGNFVARRKCSFLPAPRTLFFFELMHSLDFTGVITCTPLGIDHFYPALCIINYLFRFVCFQLISACSSLFSLTKYY